LPHFHAVSTYSVAMKRPMVARIITCVGYLHLGLAGQASPVSKAIELLSNLEAKIIADGASKQKLYDAFAEMCSDRSKDLSFQIKKSQAEIADLKATDKQEAAIIGSLTSELEGYAEDIATAEADLTAATNVRAKESADFAAEELSLSEVINAIERAISVLERKSEEGDESFLQTEGSGDILQSLGAMVRASMISTADAPKLMAFMQTENGDSDDDSDADEASGAPSAVAYKSRSSSIVDALENIREKAETQLVEMRKREVASRHNFELLKASLLDEKFVTEKMAQVKKDRSASTEKKSETEADQTVASK